MAEALIDGLNEQQREIVFAPLSNIFVVAGAGTGKTRVLISRLVYLLEEENLKPWQIVAVTFTNKAAHEMEERLVKAMGWEKNQGLLMSTFHSFCHRMLRRFHVEAKLPANFSLISTSDQENIIRHFYDDYGIVRNDPKFGDFKTLELTPKQVAARISSLKERGISPSCTDAELEDVLVQLANMWRALDSKQLFEIAYAYYKRVCAKAGILDFSDLIINALDLLLKNPDVRAHLQNRYRYICVDEFQDTNNIQYQLLMALKGPNNHILVVGDDDQSIYGWRGANSKNLNKICQDIEDMQIYELSINYRSTQNILNVANAVINDSPDRLIRKFLINPETYELSKENDIKLLLSVESKFMNHAFKKLNIPVVQGMSLEAMLRMISYRYREDLIQYLVSLSAISFDDLKEREKFKWIRHTDDKELYPLVNFARIVPNASYSGFYVENIIKKMINKGFKYEDIAILYRNNSLSAPIEERLSSIGIPYQMYGGLKFYERSEIADVICYLRLIANRNDDLAFSRIVNTPRRGIGSAAEARLKSYAQDCGLSLYEALSRIIASNDKESLKTFKKFIPFYELIESLSSQVSKFSLSYFIVKVIEQSGLDNYFASLDKKDRSARLGVSRQDNIEQLIANAESFCNHHKDVSDELRILGQDTIEQFINSSHHSFQGDLEFNQEESEPLTDSMKSNYENFLSFITTATLSASTETTANGMEVEKGVNLMTIHASKGLEFPVVIVLGCEEDILPSARADDIEEERRLAYVAFTRASQYLFVSYASERKSGYGRSYYNEDVPVRPSRFLVDVNKHYKDPDFKKRIPFYVTRVTFDSGY